MNQHRKEILIWAVSAAALLGLALLPRWLTDEYYLSLMISILMYCVLATAWALFSGPTRYISLATVAFFGMGAYVTAVFGESLPWVAVLGIAAGVGLVMALIVGLSTLRLSGVYFVIFSFGLAELVKQLVTWWEVNITKDLGRYVFVEITQLDIYWQLLAMLALVLALRALINRSRLGLALRVIGEDETVATHVGINTTTAKLLLFAVSAVFITVTGAIMAPRWTYIDPSIAFAPAVSFQTLIMALLGGAGALFGPILGAVPLVLLFEYLAANFPNHFSILLGLVFIVIVYFIPQGLSGVLARLLGRLLGRNAASKGDQP
jgi:branched-chain amino acid transport system permease protein